MLWTQPKISRRRLRRSDYIIHYLIPNYHHSLPISAGRVTSSHRFSPALYQSKSTLCALGSQSAHTLKMLCEYVSNMRQALFKLPGCLTRGKVLPNNQISMASTLIMMPRDGLHLVFVKKLTAAWISGYFWQIASDLIGII